MQHEPVRGCGDAGCEISGAAAFNSQEVDEQYMLRVIGAANGPARPLKVMISHNIEIASWLAQGIPAFDDCLATASNS